MKNKTKISSSSFFLLLAIWMDMANAEFSNTATLPRTPMVELDSWIDSDSKDRPQLHGENQVNAATAYQKIFGSEINEANPRMHDVMPALSNRQYPSPLGTEVNWRFDLRCTIQKEKSQTKNKAASIQRRMFDLRQSCFSEHGFREPFFPCDSDDAAEHQGSFHVCDMKEVCRCSKTSSNLNQRNYEKVMTIQF
jgi:hypothetical protein